MVWLQAHSIDQLGWMVRKPNAKNVQSDPLFLLKRFSLLLLDPLVILNLNTLYTPLQSFHVLAKE